MISILHIIERLSSAGPDRALLAAVTYALQLGLPQRHTICALEGATSPLSLLQAHQAGVTVLRRPTHQEIHDAIAAADVVVVHFWNNPALYALLRAALPPMRLLIWATIYGHCAPQVITPELVALADQFLVKAPGVLALPVFQGLQPQAAAFAPRLLYSPLEIGRLAGYQPRPHTTFNVGYIGTVNFTKLHARYVPMSAGVNIPDVRFVVCGGGIEQELAAQAAALGALPRFDFRGYVQTILPVLEELDVFGYPLCEDSYATSERALQEAMWVGIPPVVFPYAGLATLVQHEQTGLVVHTEREYQAALEYLYHYPAERQRLGENARRFARATFDPFPIVQQLDAIYQQLLTRPKRTPCWDGGEMAPAAAFVAALGAQAGPFATSLYATADSALLTADAAIAQASPLLRGGEGGIIHYRNYYPDDAYLHLWTGLVMESQGKLRLALQEYHAAIDLGLSDWRGQWYLARVAAQLQEWDVASRAGQAVVRAAPDFAPAHDLLQRSRLHGAVDSHTDSMQRHEGMPVRV